MSNYTTLSREELIRLLANQDAYIASLENQIDRLKSRMEMLKEDLLFVENMLYGED